MSEVITNSEYQDIETGLIEDIIPERLVKVYPYLLPNTNKSKAFINNNSTTLAYITQVGLSDDLLKTDSNGNKYFEMMPSISYETRLDISSQTSTFGLELKEEPIFTGYSNYFYETERDKIQLGDYRFVPAIFSIGKPFNKDEYEKGQLPIFLSSSTVESKMPEIGNIIGDWGQYETVYVNITAIESQFTNSRIFFTSVFDTSSDEILTFDGNQNGVTLGFENHTLINFIKGKGIVQQFSDQGVAYSSEFGEIDFVSKEPLAPFKMTPVDDNEKITMYADWFDYDNVMPFVFIEKFKAGESLSAVITDVDDRRMVEDMLLISAGFAESWASAPVLTSGGDAGKIDPEFRAGHKGTKIGAIAGKDPVKVIDGIFENHIRKFPAFSTDITRYQPVKEVLCALSRYLYTSYSIGKGQNAYNQVYLPWYLEPSIGTPIRWAAAPVKVPNPDAGGTGQVDSFVFDSSIKFQAKTGYYRDKHTDPKNLLPTNELILPTSVNLSNVVMHQTDRKLTQPQINDILQPINKLPLPGDINTKSSQDLSYIWYLPINTQQKIEEFFLNSLTTTSTTQPGQEITVHLPPGVLGKKWTQEEAHREILRQAQGNIKVIPSITNIVGRTNTSVLRDNELQVWYDNKRLNIVETRSGGSLSNPTYYPVSEDIIKREIQRVLNYEDLDAIIIRNNTLKARREIIGGRPKTAFRGSFVADITRSRFTPAVVISSGGISDTYSFEERQVLFDKQGWRRFLSSFNITPNTTIDYHLLEKNDFRIKQITELAIGSCWGNFVELKVNGRVILKIPMFNADDETLGIQRILFT